MNAFLGQAQRLIRVFLKYIKELEKVAPIWFSVSASTFVASVEVLALNNAKKESKIRSQLFITAIQTLFGQEMSLH